jgi:hypothetical protein
MKRYPFHHQYKWAYTTNFHDTLKKDFYAWAYSNHRATQTFFDFIAMYNCGEEL